MIIDRTTEEHEYVARRQQQLHSEYAHMHPDDALYILCRRHALHEFRTGIADDNKVGIEEKGTQE